MQSRYTTLSMLGAAIGSLVLAGSLASAPPASAKGYYSDSTTTLSPGAWKIDVAKSHFGPDYSTIVIERADTSSGAHSASGNFVVISNGNVYLATAPEGYGAKNVDYSGWKDMRLVQVGEKAQSIDPCMFRCLTGVVERWMTLRFRNIDAGMPELRSAVALNAK